MGQRLAPPEEPGGAGMSGTVDQLRVDQARETLQFALDALPTRRSTLAKQLAQAVTLLTGTVGTVTRHTRLGVLPVDVTTVDRLDEALGKTSKMLEHTRSDLLKSQSQSAQDRADASWAIRYAKARIKMEDPDSVAFMTLEEKAAAKIELKRARREYLEWLERQQEGDSHDY